MRATGAALVAAGLVAALTPSSHATARVERDRYADIVTSRGGAPVVVAQTTPAPAAQTTTPPQPVPSAAATSPYAYVYRATPSPENTPFPGPGAPQIIEIDLSGQYLVTPGDLAIRVVTNPEVEAVTASTMGYSVNIPKTGPGTFGGGAHVGDVPFFIKNKLWDISFIAQVPGGRTAVVTLPLGLK